MVNRLSIAVFFLFSTVLFAQAQETDTLQSKKDEVEGLVSLYRFMLNTVGAASTPVSEKETIINSSYKKVFRDEEVQIEDDLVAGRDVLLNKSVKGYLRDVDFFFKVAAFEFSDQEITVETNEVGDLYYKVKFVCNLNAVDLDDSTVTRTYDRFIEINDLGEHGLKIVSVYTVGSDPKQQLMDWWVSMDSTWQTVFFERMGRDSMTSPMLKQLTKLDSLDLSGQIMIDDISPLIQLRQLRWLNLAGTQVQDVLPIRYASRLEGLDLSGTLVDSIQVFDYLPRLQTLKLSGCSWLTGDFLHHLPNMKDLDLSETSLLDYSGLEKMTKLERLDLSGSTFQLTSVLGGLNSLSTLDLSRTTIQQVDFGDGLSGLKELDLSNSYITEIGWINQLPKLEVLSIDYTQVADLAPTKIHPSLKKVYADFTQVKEAQVRNLMQAKSGLLILTETDQLISWWNELSDPWQKALMETGGWKKMPSIESLIIFLQRDSLDLSGRSISDSKPLDRFRQLSWLDISGTQISDLQVARELTNLMVLDVSNSAIESLEGIQHLHNLTTVNAANTNIQSIGLMEQLDALSYLNIDATKVPLSQTESYVLRHPDQVVIYRTEVLQSWWDNLQSGYKDQLKLLLGDYSVENLHKLTSSTSLELTGVSLDGFHQLEVFSYLERLSISRVTESYLPDLTAYKRLTQLSWTSSPLVTISALKVLTQIKSLNISNTAVDDLSPLEGHPALESLDCSSTQVKSIRPLKEVSTLKSLNISNTRVWQLNWLYDIRGIETLICFNSRVSDRQLGQFQEQFPDCKITNF